MGALPPHSCSSSSSGVGPLLHRCFSLPAVFSHPRRPPVRHTTTGVDAGFVTAIAPADEAVLVTTPDITALRDADRIAGLLECDGIKEIKIIVNRVRPDLVRGEDMMSALDVQEMLGLPLLGVVPEDSEVIRSTNRGMPLVLTGLQTPAGLALEQATWRLVERDAMTAVMVEEQERPKKKGGFFSFFGG